MNQKYQEYLEKNQSAWKINKFQLPPPPPQIELAPPPSKALLHFSFSDNETEAVGSFMNGVKVSGFGRVLNTFKFASFFALRDCRVICV